MTKPEAGHLPSKADEAARLAALDSYGILDTPAEQGFDDIVLLATQICEAPVALVSLVVGDRQWFKARIGFDAWENGSCVASGDVSRIHPMARDATAMLIERLAGHSLHLRRKVAAPCSAAKFRGCRRGCGGNRLVA